MILCFLFSALIVVLDQVFKQWIVRSLALGSEGPVIIPGVLGLTRWENDGAMLNVLSGQQWLLAGIALLAAVVLVMILLRYNEGFWGTLALSAVLGGTVGNLFDRVFNDGKVIDMFRTLFINFPIFNIADIFITLGFITFLIHFIYLTIKTGKEESSAGRNRPADGYAYQQDDALNATPGDVQPIYMPQTRQAQPEVPVHVKPVTPAQPAPVYYEAAVNDPVYQQQPVSPPLYAEQSYAPAEAYVAPEQYGTAADSSIPGDYSSISADASDISLTLEALEAELGSLDVDYDVDELLREYGIENDDYTV